MAEETSSQTCRETEIETQNPIEVSIPPALKILINSIKTFSNNPLTFENYLIWSAQILKIFKANGFAPYLDNSSPVPPKFLTSNIGVPIPNPQYNQWVMIDQNLSAAIFSTISTPILPYILNLETTAAIWDSLAKRLQATHRSRFIQLKNDLHHVSMKTNTMRQYLAEVKSIVDLLATAGSPVEVEDVLLYTLNGLPPSYQAFKTAIRTRTEALPLEDFYALLCSEETNLAMEANQQSVNNTSTLYASRGRGRFSSNRGRGRPPYRGGRSTSSGRHNSPVTCQICGKFGHTARMCWHRSNMDYPAPSENTTNSALLATHSGATSTADQWYLDSGASAHLSANYQNLQQPQPYHGTDQVTVGNGHAIPITHTGHSSIPTDARKLNLPVVYHSPQLNHNLISIQSLTHDNNCIVSFNSHGFQIKDPRTNQVLIQ